MRFLVVLVIAFPAAFGQQWEAGVFAGGAFLNRVSLQGAPVAVSAGFRAGPVAGASLSHNLYPRLAGEIRYGFEHTDARLSSGGSTSAFSGQAHVLDYDLVIHARPRNHPLRPYLSAGAGIKIFRGTGSEVAYRPLMQYGYLTRAREWKPMLVFGGGVKFRLRGRLLARIEIRDQLTRFPQKIIAPAPGITIQGWLQDVVPTVGLAWIY